MRIKPPKYAYLLAIILGLLTFFLPVDAPVSIITILVFLFIGGLLGFHWPNQSWRWGLWVAAPMVFFLGLSVLFAGQVEAFLQKDLPQLLIAITAACLGSFITSWYKQRQKV